VRAGIGRWGQALGGRVSLPFPAQCGATDRPSRRRLVSLGCVRDAVLRLPPRPLVAPPPRCLDAAAGSPPPFAPQRPLGRCLRARRSPTVAGRGRALRRSSLPCSGRSRDTRVPSRLRGASSSWARARGACDFWCPGEPRGTPGPLFGAASVLCFQHPRDFKANHRTQQGLCREQAGRVCAPAPTRGQEEVPGPRWIKGSPRGTRVTQGCGTPGEALSQRSWEALGDGLPAGWRGPWEGGGLISLHTLETTLGASPVGCVGLTLGVELGKTQPGFGCVLGEEGCLAAPRQLSQGSVLGALIVPGCVISAKAHLQAGTQTPSRAGNAPTLRLCCWWGLRCSLTPMCQGSGKGRGPRVLGMSSEEHFWCWVMSADCLFRATGGSSPGSDSRMHPCC